MSTTVPSISSDILMMSFNLKGLKLIIKIPQMMFESASWEAKSATEARTPVPLSGVVAIPYVERIAKIIKAAHIN